MNHFYPSVEREFSTGHDLIENLPTCSYDGHGHRWRVRVVVKGTYDPRIGSSYKINELAADMDLLVRDLDGRPMSKMLPGILPSPEGVGLWFIERLATAHPKIVEVVVWVDQMHRFSIARELL